MKMRDSDFSRLKRLIDGVISANPNMKREYMELGLTSKRYRWDLLWLSRFEVVELYDYLNDDHIDTALRKIVS